MFWQGKFRSLIALNCLIIWHCFFNRSANKSPKLTPTRTVFTSKAAAAQLSSPLASGSLASCTGSLAFFSSGFVVSALSPIQRSLKLLAFSAQRLGGSFRLFGSALHVLQRQAFTSFCKGNLVAHSGFGVFQLFGFGNFAALNFSGLSSGNHSPGFGTAGFLQQLQR